MLLSNLKAKFREMFSSSSYDLKTPILIEEDVSLSAVQSILESLYFHKITLTEENLDGLAILTSRYQIPTLDKIISRYFACATLDEILSYFRKTNSGVQVIVEFGEEVLEHSEWLNLSSTQIKSIISSDNFIVPEITIFRGVIKWGTKKLEASSSSSSSSSDSSSSYSSSTTSTEEKQSLTSVLSEILPSIRFPLMTDLELTSIVAPTGVLSSGELVAILTQRGSRGSVKGGHNFSTKQRGIS